MDKLKIGIKHIFYIFLHPFDGFWILKSERKGNLETALLIMACLIVTTITRFVNSGYLFASATLGSFSPLLLALGVALIGILYCVSNWSLTTLLDGNGSFKYIFISTMYSITPIILFNLPILYLTNTLTLDEAGFIGVMNAISIVWSLFLLLAGNMSIHEYTMVKSIFTVIGTFIIMVLIAVLAVLFFNLVQQLYTWLLAIIKELLFRL